MYSIRTTKTGSGATAVQVVKYVDRKLIIATHIGSAREAGEILELKKKAQAWIETTTSQSAIFGETTMKNTTVVALDKYEYLGVYYTYIYEVLSKLVDRFRFNSFGSKLLNDLVIMRIIEPASKLQTLELLQKYFDISHRRQTFYETLPRLVNLKDEVEREITKVAAEEFGCDFSLVFYDVTTLYFESFSADDLRKPGFSKDHKSNQPQIVMGLMVNSSGFPLSYEVFEGNKFEGKTMLPVIQSFQKRHGVQTLTVVADAAMISMENIEALKLNELSYIVGARVANLSRAKIKEISGQLNQFDLASIRIQTKHGTLICDFSAKRYKKDKHEMEKQIKKAEYYLKNPAHMKKAKFLQNLDKGKYVLNTNLKEKTESLLGIKGYYTNLGSEVLNQTIIAHYHSLWHVEQTFRMAKHDLQTRPIFHYKQDAVKTHILICFMALAVSKYMEIKTGIPIKRIITSLRQITDARMLNVLTNEETVMRTRIPDNVIQIMSKLALSY